MYVYVKLIHFAMQQKLTQHCKPTTLQQKLIKKKKASHWLLHQAETTRVEMGEADRLSRNLLHLLR